MQSDVLDLGLPPRFSLSAVTCHSSSRLIQEALSHRPPAVNSQTYLCRLDCIRPVDYSCSRSLSEVTIFISCSLSVLCLFSGLSSFRPIRSSSDLLMEGLYPTISLHAVLCLECVWPDRADAAFRKSAKSGGKTSQIRAQTATRHDQTSRAERVGGREKPQGPCFSV